jgi:hypothetical protein
LALHRPSPSHVAATAVRLRREAAPIPISWTDVTDLLDARIAVVL